MFNCRVPARTVWFRLIHNRIPHAQLLDYRFLKQFPSAQCCRCRSSEDSIFHFFFTCPLLDITWSTLSQAFTSHHLPSKLPDFLFAVFKSLQSISDFPPRNVETDIVPNISSVQILTCILQAIWSSHWAMVFHEVPFQPPFVLPSALHLIHQLADELTIHKII